MFRLFILVCSLLPCGCALPRSADNYYAFELKSSTISHNEYSLTNWNQAAEQCYASLTPEIASVGDALADLGGLVIHLVTLGRLYPPTWFCELPTPLRGSREELEPRLLMPLDANARRVRLRRKYDNKWVVRIDFANQPVRGDIENAMRTILADGLSILANRIAL